MRWERRFKETVYKKWYRWYAWRPVFCWQDDEPQWVWREWVWQRKTHHPRPFGYSYTEKDHRITEPSVSERQT